jgi:hypothetical protein
MGDCRGEGSSGAGGEVFFGINILFLLIGYVN